jgi:hypothetical protein
MNLRVDLILQTEQRSASVLNLKALTRIAIITVPAILVVMLLMVVLQVMSLKSDVNRLTAEWDSKKPEKEKAEALSAEMAKARGVMAEFTGWQNSRVCWHEQLAGLMGVIPDNMVLDMLRVDQRVDTADGSPSRASKIILSGKSYGDQSEQNVILLRRDLTEIEKFSNLIHTVEVRLAPDDTKGADKNDRNFNVDVTYKSRKFE